MVKSETKTPEVTAIGTADAASEINIIMKHDYDLDRDLNDVLDMLQPKMGRCWDVFAEELGEDVLFITFDSDVGCWVGSGGSRQFHPVCMLARVSGTYKFQRFSAHLQIHRDPDHLDDIVDIRWTVENPVICRAWVESVTSNGKLAACIQRRQQNAPSLPDGVARHVWPWRFSMGLIWSTGQHASPASQAFSRWVQECIPDAVLRLLGDRHPYQDGEILVFFQLTNASTQSTALDGLACEPMMAPTLLLLDAPSVVALNWVVTIGLRLAGISIHAFADDDWLGMTPIAADMVEPLKHAQTQLWGWLVTRWGEDRSIAIRERLCWVSGLGFSSDIAGTGDDRVPVCSVPSPFIQGLLRSR